MDSSSLDSVLGEEAADTETPEVQQTAQVEQQQDGAAEVVTGEEQTGSPPEAKQDDPLEKHRKGLEAAAAAERKRRQDAENRAEAAERRARELEQQFHRPPQAKDQPSNTKPVRADFQSEDEWVEAVLDWRDSERAAQWQAQQAQQAAIALKAKTESIFAEASKLPGFDMQKFAALPVPDAMADAILDSDAAPQLVHFLTANPGEAYRIAALPATRQVKELARIEDRLLANAQEEKPEQEQEKVKPKLPETLTQARDARGRFDKAEAYDGPTPLDDVLKSK